MRDDQNARVLLPRLERAALRLLQVMDGDMGEAIAAVVLVADTRTRAPSDSRAWAPRRQS